MLAKTGHLVKLVEKTVPRMCVVIAIQKATRLVIFKWFSRGSGLSFLALKMIPILISQSRKPKVENVGILRCFSKDFAVGSLLLNLLNDRIWWWHTSRWWQL